MKELTLLRTTIKSNRMDQVGEVMYLYSKSDGRIRHVVTATPGKNVNSPTI